MSERTEQREAGTISTNDIPQSSRIHRAGWLLGSVATLLITAGCGGDNGVKPHAPAPPAAPGAGSLVIQASATGVDVGGGAFTTDFEAIVTDTLGASVSGATVAITDDGGSIALVEEVGTPGTYRASRAGLPSGTLMLDLTAGEAQLLGATVSAPDLHMITSHGPNDVIQSSNPIHLTWSRAAAATEAVVETKNYQGGPETDDGTKTIPTPGNPARNDQAIRVTRTNRAAISGAASGSTFAASVRNSVEPIVAQ